MRKLLGVIAASFLAIGVAGQAHAVALGFDGTFTISLVGNNVEVPGSGTATVTTTGSHINSLALAGGTFVTSSFVLPITDPAAAPIKGLQVTAANNAGSFSGSPLGGVMGLSGATKVCLFLPCASATANLTVPFSPVGVGGVAYVTNAVNLTVVGAPWTTGTVQIGTSTAAGGRAPASSTAMASGTVGLVTPVFVSTNIALSAVVPVFGFLNLHFVPEPGTLVLLGSGIAGLVAFGRNSRNRK